MIAVDFIDRFLLNLPPFRTAVISTVTPKWALFNIHPAISSLEGCNIAACYQSSEVFCVYLIDAIKP